MRKLLLLLALLAPGLASAQTQWTFSRIFPDSSQTKAHDNPHGIAVDPAGKVWIQPNLARSGDSVFVPALGGKRIANVIYVFNPDGTPASFSPIKFLDFPGGGRDTLGGMLTRNATTGALQWETKSGRGLAKDGNGNIIAAHFNHVYRINYQTGAGMNRAITSTIASTDSRGLAGPAVDRTGRVFVTGVFPGDPIAVLNPDFTFRENVTAADPGFSRGFTVSATGDTVYYAGYDKKYILRYTRPDEFSPYSTPDTLLRGMAVESFAWHPTTKQLWLGAGSPNDVPASPYIRNTWYAFNVADLNMPFPPKRDSIVWNGRTTTGAATSGRPRGQAFSPDGNTSYVIQFSNVSEPFGVRQFVKVAVGINREEWLSAEDLITSISPNPVRDQATVRFRVPLTGRVAVRVFDALGREVSVLVDDVLTADTHTRTFDTAGLAAGTYYVRYEVQGRAVSRALAVVK